MPANLELRADNLVGKTIVSVGPRHYRLTEVEPLLGDLSKDKAKLGWMPETTFEEMIRETVNVDLNKAKRFIRLNKQGLRIPE